MREKIELLAPAGDMERLKMAVAYGADAVYLAGNTFGMRSFAGNFSPEELAAGKRYEQLDLFGDDGAQSYGSDSTSEKDGEHDIQRALLDVKRKFGRNAVIKAMDMEDGATGQDRNRQIGGHRA